MATLGTLRNVVARKIGLDNEDDSDEQNLIDEWINQGIVEILVRTHVNVECADLDTDADVWKYTLPSGLLAIRNIWRDGARHPMERVDEHTILELRGRALDTGDDADLTRYATVGSNLLLIWPTPTEAYSLDIFYVPRPTALSNEDDDPSSENLGRIPTEFHKGIEYYALAQAADYDDDQSSGIGSKYQQDFDNYIMNYMLPAIRKKGGRTLPQARIKTERGLVRQHNDVYG